MIPHFDRLVAAVQTNCHIADAQHAGDLTLCTYLLEMREFYRWENGMALAEQPARAEVGKWIAERETLWQSFEKSDPLPLPIADRFIDPFDTAAINAALIPHGLVYGAGTGRFGKPQFYLGKLARVERRDGVEVLVSGREYARDLSAPPAALRDATVHLRMESLERWLWERFEVWAVKRPDGALKATLLAYGFDVDPDAALKRMAAAESETLIQHELGEFQAGERLGTEWRAMRAGTEDRRAELVLRAMRDNLADCLVTLPALLERRATASIHFWFSNFDGMRRELFPTLAQAYGAWNGGDQRAMESAVQAGREHWLTQCRRALELYRDRGGDAASGIAALCEDPNARL
jgi:hypothetical protein